MFTGNHPLRELDLFQHALKCVRSPRGAVLLEDRSLVLHHDVIPKLRHRTGRLGLGIPVEIKGRLQGAVGLPGIPAGGTGFPINQERLTGLLYHQIELPQQRLLQDPALGVNQGDAERRINCDDLFTLIKARAVACDQVAPLGAEFLRILVGFVPEVDLGLELALPEIRKQIPRLFFGQEFLLLPVPTNGFERAMKRTAKGEVDRDELPGFLVIALEGPLQ